MADFPAQQQSGTEFRRQQESVADIMRQKQLAGMFPTLNLEVSSIFLRPRSHMESRDADLRCVAAERKAAGGDGEAAGKMKK
jgi:hypothetical protein